MPQPGTRAQALKMGRGYHVQETRGAWKGCVVDNEAREVTRGQAVRSLRAVIG